MISCSPLKIRNNPFPTVLFLFSLSFFGDASAQDTSRVCPRSSENHFFRAWPTDNSANPGILLLQSPKVVVLDATEAEIITVPYKFGYEVQPIHISSMGSAEHIIPAYFISKETARSMQRAWGEYSVTAHPGISGSWESCASLKIDRSNASLPPLRVEFKNSSASSFESSITVRRLVSQPAAVVKTICQGEPLPADHVIVGMHYSESCGKPGTDRPALDIQLPVSPMEICSESKVPSGYVVTASNVSSNCGSAQPNELTIRIPTSSPMQICADQSRIPKDYVVVSSISARTDDGVCYGLANIRTPWSLLTYSPASTIETPTRESEWICSRFANSIPENYIRTQEQRNGATWCVPEQSQTKIIRRQ